MVVEHKDARIVIFTEGLSPRGPKPTAWIKDISRAVGAWSTAARRHDDARGAASVLNGQPVGVRIVGTAGDSER